MPASIRANLTFFKTNCRRIVASLPASPPKKKAGGGPAFTCSLLAAAPPSQHAKTEECKLTRQATFSSPKDFSNTALTGFTTSSAALAEADWNSLVWLTASSTRLRR